MLKKNGLDYNRRGVLLHYAFWTQEYIHELCQHFGKRTCYRSVSVCVCETNFKSWNKKKW